jgi:Hint domain
MATYTWTSSSSGLWSTTTNWSASFNTAGPGGNVLVIAPSTAETVTLNSGVTWAAGASGQLLIGGGAGVVTLEIDSGGTLAQTGTSNNIYSNGNVFLNQTAATAGFWLNGENIASGGRIYGYGTVGVRTASGTFTFQNGSTLEAGNGGTVSPQNLIIQSLTNTATTTLSIGNTATVQVDHGAVLNLGSTGALSVASPSSSNAINFQNDTGELIVNVATPGNYFSGGGTAGSPYLFKEQLNNLEFGSTTHSSIDIANIGTAAVTTSYASNTLTVIAGGSTYYEFTIDNGGTLSNVIGNDTTTGAGDVLVYFQVCFAAGTHIATTGGEVAVEDLAEGDQIVTVADGRQTAMPARWIGRRYVDLTRHPHPEKAAPVHIRPHAFGDNLPARELVVSPDHAIFLDGKLVPAKLLVNGMTIVQDVAARSVTYYHVELDRHAIMLAEGLPVESYLDTGNRAFFSNAGLALVLHPDFEVNAHLKCWEEDACAPLAVSPDLVGPIWQRAAERAKALGYASVAPESIGDADVHLRADGMTLRPAQVDGSRYVFVLPAGASDIRLGSRANLPADLTPYNGDDRRLGVAVSRIVVQSGDGVRVVPLDHPALTDGWYQVEREQDRVWRWTNGDASLPLSGIRTATLLELHLQPMPAYAAARPWRIAA